MRSFRPGGAVAGREYTPRDYQTLATTFILQNQRCALWAKPGLGKTSVIYSVLDLLKLLGSGFFPVLVIAPKKVCELVWPAEQSKWREFRNLKVVTILGTVGDREDALLTKADIYVINYDNIQWLVERLGDRWPFKIVVADESTRLKNFRTKQGGKRSHALSTIAQQTGRWIELTGTPSPNGLKDLWGQIWFLDFGVRLGRSYKAFMDRWFHVDPYTRIVSPRGNAEKEIHDAVADITLALRPEDWFDIHDPVETTVECELPPESMAIYKVMERDYFAELGEVGIFAPNAAALSMKLLQMASGMVYNAEHVALPMHDAKIEALRSIVEESAGEPIIVVYHFQFEVPKLKKAFPEARQFKTKKDEDDWNAGKIPMLLVHPQSGGHGTNLQDGGRTMVFLTHNWDLELRLQVIERIGPVRQLQSGHQRAVMIYNIVARHTMDLEVIRRLQGKATVQEALMAARARMQGDTPADFVPSDTAEFGDLLS